MRKLFLSFLALTTVTIFVIPTSAVDIDNQPTKSVKAETKSEVRTDYVRESLFEKTLFFSQIPDLDKEVQLNFEVKAKLDFKKVDLSLQLPTSTFIAISGQSRWTGELKRDEKKSLNITVKATKKCSNEIKGVAVGTPWAAPIRETTYLYVNIKENGSQVSKEPLLPPIPCEEGGLRVEVRKIEVKPTGGGAIKTEIKDLTGVTKSADSSSVYVITRDPEKCKPFPCKTLSARQEGATIIIGDGTAEAKTTLPVKVEEDKITIEVKGQTETVILPSEVKKIVETRPEVQGPLPTKISKIELQRCKPKFGPGRSCTEESAVYKIEVEKENKLLGVVSVKSKLNYEVAAVGGRIISETKPWYLRIVPFLFKF